MWAGYVMHVDAIIFYLSIREGDKAEIYKLMEGLRPAVEDASKQLGLSCGAREGLRKWRSSGPRFPRTHGMSRF